VREVTLADVAEIRMGHSPPGHTYNETGSGLPFFQGSKDFGERFPTPRVFCTAPDGRVAEPGDVLLSVRAPIGRTNVANVAACSDAVSHRFGAEIPEINASSS